MKTRISMLCKLLSLALSLLLLSAAAAQLQERQASQILKSTGTKGGLIVHIGCGDGKLTAALHTGEGCLIHGLDTDAGNVQKARTYIRSRGLYGIVSVGNFDGGDLPYIDNLVNLVVAEDLGPVPFNEVMRVLAPLGVACVKQDGKWTKRQKPWPGQIDEWNQYLHDADNNAVACDTVVGPPRHLQWVSDPAWSRSHMTIPTVAAMVSSRGRLFTIEDTATPENPFLPGRFSLIARDAFNGVVLWKHDFAEWEPITRYVKDLSVQLQRRLAAIGDTVYCTPGLKAPITALNAATGRVIKTYKKTEGTQEFAYDTGVLYAVIGDRMNAARYNIVKAMSGKGTNLGGSDPDAPFGGTGFRGAYAPESSDKLDPVCSIKAIRADSGKEIWKTKAIHGYTGCSLAIKGRYAVYQTSSGLMCLNRNTGSRIWSVEKQIAGGDGTEANTLVLGEETVYAKEGTSLHAYFLRDGSQKWKSPIASNYEKSADIFVVAGAVWTGGSKKPTSYDPDTGEQISAITQRMTGPMGHDRCYRNFITNRYYINSKTGGADFLTLDGKKEFPNHWLRGTCGMGILPCNGLLYVPPYSCQCSIGAMLKNFNVVYTEPGLASSDQRIRIEREVRLIKGPAYGSVRPRRQSGDDWPIYRHDNARSGATASNISAELKPLWKATLRTVPSAPVIADQKVFVAQVDAHSVCALDTSDGRVVWEYVAGGRVDSPPTYYKGLVLFGSRDGWVHCLRASDGVPAWRFKDLPDKLIGAFGQLESAWPISGSVLAEDDTVYFAAGRSSFLDGGIFIYALNPQTGEVKHSRRVYGPFDEKSGFPATENMGFKEDILVSDGRRLYLRHKAFALDLSNTTGGPHILPSAGFLDEYPQHRTYWTISSGGGFTGKTRVKAPSGDILVTDGKEYYEVRGFPVHRHSYFDPRMKGYSLFAGTLQAAEAGQKPRRGKRAKAAAGPPVGKWNSDIPLAGKAMVLTEKIVFVAGTPVQMPDASASKYEKAYAGELGGVLWAASSSDGSKLAKYELDASPVFDGVAAAGNRLYISLKNGVVECWGNDVVQKPVRGR